MVHIGIIPDGNRRWFKQNKINYTSDNVVNFWFQKLCDLLETGEKEGQKYLDDIQYITFYVCSIDNVHRSDGTFNFIIRFLEKICSDLFTENLKEDLFSDNFCSAISYIREHVKIVPIGNIDLIPTHLTKSIEKINENIKCPKVTLFLGIAYNYETDMYVESMNKQHEISVVDNRNKYYIREQPQIDILIRTGGEFRTSGFFPTKIVYSEFYFLKKYWPDFSIKDLMSIIKDFHCNRKRRYGC